jgi:hypothetical protein
MKRPYIPIVTTPTLTLPPPGDCVVIGKKSRHSGESRNPVAVLLNNSIFLDTRLRGHDELRHSLQRGRETPGFPDGH